MVLVVLVMAVAAVKSGVGEVTVMVMVGWLDPIGFRMISRKSIPPRAKIAQPYPRCRSPFEV